MTTDTGGPAFPRDDFHSGVPGMSLRDWFAGQALAGMCATLHGMGSVKFGLLAEDAYFAADAMLAARSAPPPAEEEKP